MTTTNQYPSGVADWATICAWIHENRPDPLGKARPHRRGSRTRTGRPDHHHLTSGQETPTLVNVTFTTN